MRVEIGPVFKPGANACRKVAIALVIVATVAGLAPVGAANSAPPANGFERNVSNSGDWHAGEPAIAVNPRSPSDVVMVWPEEEASGIYRNPVSGTYNTATGTVGYAADPAASRCGLAVSSDGGHSWQRTVLPAQTAQSPLCSDATVAAGPDGTMYAATITFWPPDAIPPAADRQGSADVVITSTDGGRTWSYPPVDAIGNRTSADRARYAPGSNPETGGEGTCDRPWLFVDQAIGTVYVSGTSDVIQFNGSGRNETWITASHDRGASFGTIYPVDNSAYPQTGAASEGASGGTLAVAYVGTSPHRSSNAVIFETSRDGGQSFSRHVLAAPVSTSAPFGINLASDPSHPGRYAIMVPTTNATGVLVYRTDNAGAQWAGPVTVSVGSNRPWLAYSPTGVLGVVGRHIYGDNSQDVLAAFSFDGGSRFGSPVTVNHARAPAPPLGTLSLYDDVSWLILTDHDAYVGWGDWRRTQGDPNGETNAWMARMSLLTVSRS